MYDYIYVLKIGASGGVYCLITAHLATLMLNWKDDIYIIKKRIRKGKIAQPKKRGVIIRYFDILKI